MPPRSKRDKRRHSTHITTEAIALFRRGIELQRSPHDPYELRDIKIALAAALSRSKFAANPLDLEPRSLISGDRGPADVVLGIRAQLLSKIRTKDFE
ncbi:hypothetical protein ABIF73_003848 [Bradyrhizobium japonicum]|uniref:hypothetical protein n=1 Tax=Bradyrhizobium japonicum TaxID=375 RepID=UPI00339786DE